MLQELYFAAKKGKITTLKEVKQWLNEQERVKSLQVAAKSWTPIELQHDGKGIRLRDWPNSREQYVLICQNVDDGMRVMSSRASSISSRTPG